jgi:hypothetical protein
MPIDVISCPRSAPLPAALAPLGEKGGHAGLLCERNKYRWEDGKLTMIESVSQTQGDPAENTYRLTTKRFDSGRLVAEKTKFVRAPEATPRAIP